ncbi:YbaB/EbfC family nucleoid-associated protein [Rhizomonospora bruguierae]|uniref:YbaB/EbfC family nucleoid-associated protein n=1 Tax=Rhizomonospora bruguierae TaxID=1581705 RepID=UPI001BCAC859|nr:YbaB/EbfC family nucleoid-associated protein [Micromonospora sp. NBRC 107566]
MTGYADRIAASVVRVTSPDQRITGELVGGSTITIRFATGAYRRYREPDLERQLVAVAMLLIVGRERLSREVWAATTGAPAPDDGGEGERSRRFRQLRAAMYVEGTSPGGLVRITATGLREWTVTVATGAIATTPEPEFAVELRGAVADFVGAYARGMAALKQDCFGTDFARIVGPHVPGRPAMGAHR